MNDTRGNEGRSAGPERGGDADQYFKLLLSEKEYVDREISAHLQANLKILGTVFTVIVAVLGWLFSTDTGVNLMPHQLGLVLLALVALASVATLMGINFNGLAFGYIAYKTDHLGPLFEGLLARPNPLVGSRFIAATPAGRSVAATTVLIAACQGVLSVVLFSAGAFLIWRSIPVVDGARWIFWTAVPLVTLVLLAALAGAGLGWAAFQANRR